MAKVGDLSHKLAKLATVPITTIYCPQKRFRTSRLLNIPSYTHRNVGNVYGKALWYLTDGPHEMTTGGDHTCDMVDHFRLPSLLLAMTEGSECGVFLFSLLMFTAATSDTAGAVSVRRSETIFEATEAAR